MLSRLLSVPKRRWRRESGGGAPLAGNVGVVEPAADPIAQQFQAIVVVVDKASGATENQLYTAEQVRTVT
ncbi:hypothetical protein KR009_011848 [Drosophila setifemur]|nr:hypothetical protein KR009_011848 [Drosophila setifemur]